MRKDIVLFLGLGLTILLWLLNFVALKFYFYWTLGWYDYMMHFLGGLLLGVLFVRLFRIKHQSLVSFLTVFISIMSVGVAWEIFEYMNGLTASTEAYRLDVIHDLIMDALGGIVAYLFTTSRTQESF